MTKTWGKPEEVVAQRIHKDQIPGLLHKEIFLENDEIGLVIRNAAIAEEISAGKHALKDFSEIILVDTATKTLRKTAENLLTADDNTVSCDLEIRFDVYLAEKLARNLLFSKTILTIDDIYSELYNELIAKALSPIVRETKISDLAGNKEIIDNIAISLETELKKTLEMWGIELINLSIIWKFPEDYKQRLKSSSAARLEEKEEGEEPKEKLKSAIRDKEIEKIKGKGEPAKEEVKSELEKESAESEVRLNIRKKEEAEDTEEALDALKLKEIMDKQKISRKAKKKTLGIE